MKRGNQTPELYTVVPGNPWTINGAASSALTPQDALAEVLATAKRFPVRISVHDGDQIIVLDMDKQGRTQAATTPMELSKPEPAMPVQIIESVPLLPQTSPAPQAREEQNENNPTESKRTNKPLRLAGIAVVVLALGAGAAFAFAGTEKELPSDNIAEATASETTAASNGWKLIEGQDAIAILGNRIITAQNTTVRILDVKTGEEVGESYEVQKPAQIRSIEGTTASAFDFGSGQVVMLREGGVELVDGVLNARGSEPVVVREDEISTADGEVKSLLGRQAVLGATSESVVFFEGPATVVFGDRPVVLKAPKPDAMISQLLTATDARVVVVWSVGDMHWLTMHDAGSGEPISFDDVGSAEVSVRSGIVWVGSDRYLANSQIEQLCAGGVQVSGTVICPGLDGWVSADGSLQFPERPQVFSRDYSVIAGTVLNVRNEQ